MLCYRLKSRIPAVEYLSTGNRITQLSAGQILSIPDTDKECGLVQTVCQGRNIAVFIEDLRLQDEWVEAFEIDNNGDR